MRQNIIIARIQHFSYFLNDIAPGYLDNSVRILRDYKHPILMLEKPKPYRRRRIRTNVQTSKVHF